MRTSVRILCASAVLWLAPPSPAAAQRRSASPPPLPALSAEAEAALDALSQRYALDVGLIQGWFRDRAVLYYDFGSATQPVAVGRVLWPIHGFDTRGNPVAIRGQRPIFSVIPGLDGYSGVFRLTYVVTADRVQPNEVRDIASAEALVNRRRARLQETTLMLNLPLIARGSRLVRDSTEGMLGWYQGREVQFFDFGEASPAPAPMWRFVRGQDAAGEPIILQEQNSLVDTIPAAPPYPDLWEIRFVRVDSSYVANAFKGLPALQNAVIQRASLTIDPPHTVRNLPIVIIDGAPVERKHSPLRAFADLRSPFPPAPTRPQ